MIKEISLGVSAPLRSIHARLKGTEKRYRLRKLVSLSPYLSQLPSVGVNGHFTMSELLFTDFKHANHVGIFNKRSTSIHV